MSQCFIRTWKAWSTWKGHQDHLKENWTLRPWEPKLLTGHAGWQSPLTTSGDVEGEGLRRGGVIDSGCVLRSFDVENLKDLKGNGSLYY